MVDPLVPQSWNDLLKMVRESKSELTALTYAQDVDSPIWYRGQSRSSYDLSPSLMRVQDGPTRERAIFNDYERLASHLLGPGKSDWEMLNDMQHYGIPTRLLDWTEVLGIAVAFALYDNADDDSDSALFILNPIALNKLNGANEVRRVPGDGAFNYKSIYWEGKPFAPQLPVAIDTKGHNERIRAQNGTFTVAGIERKPLEEIAPKVVRKVLIPAAVKPEAREFLEHANLNPFSIYPDIVGMARFIRRRNLGY